ncbi:sigma-54-dependent Fis family transcriptional regulator [Rhizobium anhuiense]|jgi:two-component system C4-dicarboxylate transport response regulator DctD|uniref:Sigma-54-dependent Fis family transcriptional regulator n=1 Tax=Rhizobium anhuiense TaxID=1184720 RepID=A0ABX4JEA9_9HYPH|nr:MULTISPECIES: sigma-54 dependent transcriptional regulator [Rhizobium]KZS54062.1 Fis family transcriptional regulator [Rhizobium anhuiense bv. trifolii]MBB3296748.1 two-component system C4-dicarboxylate transport response regulator DctD [Rhizobium sp. BK112]MBB3365963.1 two-component system C4-dicarboxylate transport response regulator DctD [Rhizobium sp. BK077]MBB3740941.1 two-component system C4-dicarboxylate transport response regulator DctD [Rhizobium sp. BK591]MBB4111354.1 two-componen
MDTLSPVALIDDDKDLRRATAQTLELAGFTVSAYDGAKAALADLPADFAGPVVTDIRMPEIDGLQLFATLQGMDADLPVILMTGHGDIPMAVQAIQDGAYDFIAKPFAADRLVQSVRRASEKRRLVLENRMLRKAAEDAQENLPLIGQTPVMENLRNILRHIADTDVDVLVAGETGSGKEVVAQILHQWSHRRKGNFVALNCGALPETVIESELFGHEAGAFTGAQKRRTGRIEHASGGTLFLDEIESMPAATQVKMLRVLEMREITPLGTNEVRPVDLRVVAAAKIDLGDPSVRGDFREDLYYRLNVVTISIPPLRERRDDIPLLFSHFAARAAERFRREVPPLSPGVRQHLASHTWPGNVRELSHYAERVVLGVEGGGAAVVPAQPAGSTLPERLERYEAEIIRDTLSANDGDVRRTIEALGIPRKTFYDKLQRHGINRGGYISRK